eukprot:SAG11_NODE_353_length_10348_cov_6.938335_12_plen_80_part_00
MRGAAHTAKRPATTQTGGCSAALAHKIDGVAVAEDVARRSEQCWAVVARKLRDERPIVVALPCHGVRVTLQTCADMCRQ